MNQFDPERPAVVHDCFHGRTFAWRPGWGGVWRRDAWIASDGLAFWDGMILDGWDPMP